MATQSTLELLKKHVLNKSRPDDTHYTSLLLKDARNIANTTGLSLYQVEEIALEAGILPERYSRNQKSLSTADQLKLHRSKVAIIGLGGLGGTVTEILARIGVCNLTLIDGDCFDESNLNRQLLSSYENLGIAKAEIAKKRVNEVNPALRAKKIEEFFTAKNGESLLEKVEIAVDCLDTIEDRFILEDACRTVSIPLVSAAIGGTSGQATVIFPGDLGLQSIYGNQESAPKRGIEASMGTLPFAALYMASVECAEVVGLLLGKESDLRHSLLLTDIADHSSEVVQFPPST